MTVSGIRILQLRGLSSSSGSGQSEVTKYICCIFEDEFFMNVAVKSAILFWRKRLSPVLTVVEGLVS